MTTNKRNIRRPQQFEESKVEGYFMISRRDALIAVTNKLTGSQLRLWIYLMAIDSFADYTQGGEIKYHNLPPIADIAVAIGSSPDTVDKDLRKLRKLGLYDYRTVTVQGHNLTAARAKTEAERLSKSKSGSSSKANQGKSSAYLSGGRDYLSGDAAYLSGGRDYLSGDAAYLSGDAAYLSPQTKLEALPDNGFNSPQTIQTYTDFIDSLSDSERESFEKFVREEWRKLKGEEVVSLERFLSREEDIKNWHEKFLNSPAGRAAKEEAIATQFDWRNDPRFDDWIWKAFNEGYLWTQSDEAEREQRHAFLRWAQTTNAYKGVCY